MHAALAVSHPVLIENATDGSVLVQVPAGVSEEVKLDGLPVEVTEADRAALVRAVAGLTCSEAQLAFRGAAVRAGGLFPAAVRVVSESKTQVIRKLGILEYWERTESFNQVGGLGKLLGRFGARAPVFAATARYAGLPVPKGVLLVGVPGCGKRSVGPCVGGRMGRAASAPRRRPDLRLAGGCVGGQPAPCHPDRGSGEPLHPVDRRGGEGVFGRARPGRRRGGGARVRLVSELAAGQAQPGVRRGNGQRPEWHPARVPASGAF